MNVTGKETGAGRWLAIMAAALILAACAPHQIFRPDLALCSSADPQQDCQTSAIQRYHDPARAESSYYLGFVEFDDQGQLWRRKQMGSVVDQVNKLASEEDVLIIVFAHGWKHSAAPGDSNITDFRQTLQQVSKFESYSAALSGNAARKVIGVYLGWRGASVTAPVLKELTFWDRKSTAQKVGYGGVAEVLWRLELVKKIRDAQLQPAVPLSDERRCESAESRTRLVVIGHSFGGALVYTAISQLLEERFIQTTGTACGNVADARGFGSLAVLINPAFEANLFTPLSDMTTERRTYFPAQRPVLAVLTSEADDATKIAFPIGRSFSTVFEVDRVVERANPVTKKEEMIDQYQANITAVGHFEPYQTHYLKPSDKGQNTDGSMTKEMVTVKNVREAWEKDAPNSTIQFQGTVLTRSANSVGRNPYLVVKVNKDLIPDHTEINDPRIRAFLRQLIFMSVH